MPDSYKALCSDFYVNQRIKLKMDLPGRRDTVLALFDRIRRDMPSMDRFRRYANELALESSGGDGVQEWLSLRRTSIRSGVVNPDSFEHAYRLHRLVLEVAPYFLDISPLDLDHVELLFGFDLLSTGNHDAIVFEALVSGSPLASLQRMEGGRVLDCQPLIGIEVGGDAPVEAVFEVKTRSRDRVSRGMEPVEEAISVFLAVRKVGPVTEIGDLSRAFDRIAKIGEELVASQLVPTLLMPIREAIVSGRFE